MLEVDCLKMWGRPLLFLSLKKKGTNKIRDFRPISLIRNIYKILTKVLAERLQKVLPSIISYPQGAFVHGQQILLLMNVSIPNSEMHLQAFYAS